MGQTFITASQIDNVQHVFDTVALMVASADLAVGDRVQTLGYTAIGDGGGNEYQIVAAGTGTADGGEYIDLATHQAKGLFPSGAYSVKQWGAIGDGGTTDNGPIITSAIAAIPQGSRLIIPAGTSYYKVDATQLSEAIVVNKKITILLYGELRGTTFVNQVNPPYIMHVTADNVKIRGRGKFSGDGTIVQSTTDNTKNPGLLRIDSNGCKVKGIEFERYPQIGVYLNDGDENEVSDCLFKGNATSTAAGVSYFAIRAENVTEGTRILNNKFNSYDSTHHNINNIVLLGSTHKDAQIIGNRCMSQLDQAVYANLDDSIVSGNRCGKGTHSVRGQGIKINAGSGNVVSDNKMSVLESAIQLINVSDTVVDGNNIKGFDFGYGINMYDNTGSGSAMDNMVISNNVIIGDVSASPTDMYGGIKMTADAISDNILVEGNVIRDVGQSETQEAAIKISANTGSYVSNLSILNNNIGGSLNRYCIETLRCDGVDIKDNKMVYSSTSGPAPLRPVYLNNSDNVKCDNNYIQNTLVGSVNMDWALTLSASTKVEWTNNTVIGDSGANNPPWQYDAEVTTRGNRISTTDKLRDVVTLSAAATTVVNNTNVAGDNRTNGEFSVRLTPLNTAAATLMGSSKSPYISSVNVRTSFTIGTADAAAAAGTEIFQYEIVQ